MPNYKNIYLNCVTNHSSLLCVTRSKWLAPPPRSDRLGADVNGSEVARGLTFSDDFIGRCDSSKQTSVIDWLSLVSLFTCGYRYVLVFS